MGSAERHLQEQMISLVRAFGLHQPDRTPCGEPVPVSEAHALLELNRAPSGGLSPTALAGRLHLDRSTVTRLLQRLAARGWLERECDPADGRAAVLRLTPAGREAADELAAARAVKFARVWADIPATEREMVLRALDVLARAMEQGESGRGDDVAYRSGAAGRDGVAGGVR